jgi:phosphoribosylanthranilate isomerase
MKIKATNIANLTDARYFAAKEVAFLGFCLEENNENFIPAHQVKAIKEWIEGPMIVGAFGWQSEAEIMVQIENINLDAVHLDMFSTVATSVLRDKVKVMYEIVAEKSMRAADLWEWATTLGAKSDFLILNFEKNNITWNDIIRHSELSIELLQRICQSYRVLLNLPCDTEDLKSMLSVIAPEGFVVSGGDEEKVGVKSFDELDEIFDLFEK